jgi:hypothetical protein
MYRVDLSTPIGRMAGACQPTFLLDLNLFADAEGLGWPVTDPVGHDGPRDRPRLGEAF